MVGWWLLWQLTQFNNVRQQTNDEGKPLLEPEKEADTTWTLRIGYNSYLCVLKTNGRFVQRRCVPLDFSAKCCERILPLLHNVEMAGKWQSNAGTTVSFFIPKSTTSPRPIAVLPTSYHLVGVVQAPGVAERKNTAISLGMRARSFFGGPERAGWVSLSVVESLDLRGGQQSYGAATLVVELSKAFKLSVVWEW